MPSTWLDDDDAYINNLQKFYEWAHQALTTHGRVIAIYYCSH